MTPTNLVSAYVIVAPQNPSASFVVTPASVPSANSNQGMYNPF
jgi:hypothetical protein